MTPHRAPPLPLLFAATLVAGTAVAVAGPVGAAAAPPTLFLHLSDTHFSTNTHGKYWTLFGDREGDAALWARELVPRLGPPAALICTGDLTDSKVGLGAQGLVEFAAAVEGEWAWKLCVKGGENGCTEKGGGPGGGRRGALGAGAGQGLGRLHLFLFQGPGWSMPFSCWWWAGAAGWHGKGWGGKDSIWALSQLDRRPPQPLASISAAPPVCPVSADCPR